MFFMLCGLFKPCFLSCLFPVSALVKGWLTFPHCHSCVVVDFPEFKCTATQTRYYNLASCYQRSKASYHCSMNDSSIKRHRVHTFTNNNEPVLMLYLGTLFLFDRYNRITALTSCSQRAISCKIAFS